MGKTIGATGRDGARRSFRLMAALSAFVTGLITLAALVIGGTGVAVLAGWTDQPQQVSLIPGTGLITLDVSPTWSAELAAPICQELDLGNYHQIAEQGCLGFFLFDSQSDYAQGGNDSTQQQNADVRPTDVALAGTVSLESDRGWNPLVASLYGMATLGGLVLAFVLLQLTRLLRMAAAGQPFATGSVHALRLMGLTIIGWQLAQSLLWLVLSPKAWDYSEASAGPGPALQLGPMETPLSFSTLAFGALLVLLASVFNHGRQMVEEQALTV